MLQKKHQKKYRKNNKRVAYAKSKRRRNPSSLYWRVNDKIPWRTSPAQIVARDRASLQQQQHPGVVLPSVRKRVAARRATKKTSPGQQTFPFYDRFRPHVNPRRSARHPRRNPSDAINARRGILSDFTGIGSAVMDIKNHPKGFLYLGGGALGTAIAAGAINVQLGRFMPAIPSGFARIINFTSYAGTALMLSRIPRNTTQRRQMLAGGLAVALIELMKPGSTAPMVAKIPGVGNFVAPSTPAIALRTPAVQSQPAVAAALNASAQPWYKAGGKVNPLNWLSGLENREPMPVDGVVGYDGAVYGLGNDDLMGDSESADNSMSDDMPGNDSVAGVGANPSYGTDAGQPLVMTYLNGLGCELTGRPNALNALVQP